MLLGMLYKMNLTWVLYFQGYNFGNSHYLKKYYFKGRKYIFDIVKLLVVKQRYNHSADEVFSVNTQ